MWIGYVDEEGGLDNDFEGESLFAESVGVSQAPPVSSNERADPGAPSRHEIPP